MGQKGKEYIVLDGKLEGSVQLRRPRHRWENNGKKYPRD
jgi:hypothetical protein